MIHREGVRISFVTFVLLGILNGLLLLLSGTSLFNLIILWTSAGCLLFLLFFFRKTNRPATFTEGEVFAPADGRIVVVEETLEEEFLKEKRIQVSIFMSVWNVHINWFPVEGEISYTRYHPGRYLVAWHPKSSVLNERYTSVIRTVQGREILVRQIAGAVARRIISYAGKGRKVKAGDEMGFIRFGSRVDVFLPPGSEILVHPGQRVKGLLTPLAVLK